MKINPLHDPEYRVFLQKLKQAREESGLTQVQVAQRLERHQSYVAKCEQGERRVDVIELKRFAELYDRSVEWFLP
ncbi:MAG TPA: XRE family transcriptional regulator [Leptospiraceae bacterium]|nr:transcriptional regulator [Spirochaetaceae bacterium]HBS04439.1 XRE family transcriptional regulator [Leptospiraceae bacterium]